MFCYPRLAKKKNEEKNQELSLLGKWPQKEVLRDLQNKVNLREKGYTCNYYTELTTERKDREKLGRSQGKAAGNVLVYFLGFAQVRLFLSNCKPTFLLKS